MNSIYECSSEGSECLQKILNGILFSSLLHVISSILVFLMAKLLETAPVLLFHMRHQVLESVFTETYSYISSVCSLCLAKNRPN